VGFLRTNNREYPGALEILQAGDGLLVVNELPLDEYLAGAVKAEAGDKMPLEMLKAQAIVARTYAAYHRQLNAEKSFHLVASTLNQQYVGRVPLDSVVWTAVRETAGQVLLLHGGLFPAFYHTDSGGYTEDPRAVFAAANMPALKPVRVEFPSESPHQRWRLELPLAELSAALLRGGISVGRVVALDVLERSVSLRVARVAAGGAIRGTRIRARGRSRPVERQDHGRPGLQRAADRPLLLPRHHPRHAARALRCPLSPRRARASPGRTSSASTCAWAWSSTPRRSRRRGSRRSSSRSTSARSG
jgi:stage II sporulation protein D